MFLKQLSSLWGVWSLALRENCFDCKEEGGQQEGEQGEQGEECYPSIVLESKKVSIPCNACNATYLKASGQYPILFEE